MNELSKNNPPKINKEDLKKLEQRLPEGTDQSLAQAIDTWVEIKKNGGKVVVATGSGPNLHEGVTTLLAELINKGLVDGILTSSAVAGHEMSGALEKVRRVNGLEVGFSEEDLPTDLMMEAAIISDQDLAKLDRQTPLDLDLYQRLLNAPGKVITKVAGNLAYPTGYWIEEVARQMETLAKSSGKTLEAVAGLGADSRTMIGACAQKGVPYLVTVPQMIGSGQVGLAIGDSVPITRRCSEIAKTLASADLIIESGVALTQEIHDGPFELYTGHGMWSQQMGFETYTLAKKKLIRIDLDPALKHVWDLERKSGDVADAIDQGKPKAVSMKVPFRMEMSGFARLPGSLPVLGDLGIVWPLLASEVADKLEINLDFMSYKQDSDLGAAVRQYIVDEVKRMDPDLCRKALGKA